MPPSGDQLALILPPNCSREDAALFVAAAGWLGCALSIAGKPEAPAPTCDADSGDLGFFRSGFSPELRVSCRL